MKVRSNQKGAVASFIVIGVILVIVTAGVLYWVRHKDEPSVAEKPGTTSQPVTTPAKDDDKTSQPETTTTTPAGGTTAPETTTPSTSATTPSTTTPSVTSLSQTGPADTAMELLALGALAATVASFIRSRNLRSSL